ncbi:MAG: IgGFc-binding protein [Bradymonadia bacterium]
MKQSNVLQTLSVCFFLVGATACGQDAASNPTTDPPVDAQPTGGTAGSMPDASEEACEQGARRCRDETRPEVCRDGRRFSLDDACAPNETCLDGVCAVPMVCAPNETRCVDETTLEVCTPEGTGYMTVPCSGMCRDATGVARCDDVVCTAGERSCSGDQIVVECNPNGSGYEFVENCNGARTARQCDRGVCQPICKLTEKLKTNIGCDYWAADLDNAFVPGGEEGFLDAAAEQYAVVVSNPHPEYTGEVTVRNNEEIVEQAVLPPLGLHVFNLPRRDIDGTVLVPHAYRIQSSIPIVAYQFNPLENENVFSNDASLLLPSHVLGKKYYVMTREQSFAQLRGYLTVIGIDAERPTRVRVTVTAPTRPGTGDIPALQPGETYEVDLNQYDALNLQTNAPGADLTGSLVEADSNVVVFGGSEAANAPNTNHCVDIDPETGRGVCEYKRDEPCGDNYDCNEARLNTCCADHLEEQLFPVETLGRRYIATKSFDRGNEDDYWRILAVEDDTKVETVPPQAMIPTLNAGEWFEFGSREHFEILGDKPILVGQFLASEQAPGPNLRDFEEPGDAGTGDPSFILAVPVEQYRNDFVFLCPDKYAYDYVSIIAPTNADVSFDNDVVPVAWEPVGDGAEWQIARFPVGDGVHFIEADVPVAVIVYGYDQYVSYGYPGGLNLDVVDPETGEAGDTP